MSMHKIPLTPVELAGLVAHGLDTGTPSQLSDAFRLGVAWGQNAEREACAKICTDQSFAENMKFAGTFAAGAEYCAKAIHERSNV